MPVCVFILDEDGSRIEIACVVGVKSEGRRKDQDSKQYHGYWLQVSAHRIFSEIGKGGSQRRLVCYGVNGWGQIG